MNPRPPQFLLEITDVETSRYKATITIEFNWMDIMDPGYILDELDIRFLNVLSNIKNNYLVVGEDGTLRKASAVSEV
jgi:hypothetical protein